MIRKSHGPCRRLGQVLASLAIAMWVPTLCQADIGDVDPSYGDGGWFELTNSYLATLQADGSVLFSTSSDPDGVRRQDVDGHVDVTFGIGGLKTLVPGFVLVEAIRQPDGRLLLSGFNSAGELLIARLQVDGNLDPAFGQSGVLSRPLDPERYPKLALQADDKLLLVKTSFTQTSMGDMVTGATVRRFNADGSDDPSFGQDGSTHVNVNRTRQSCCSEGGFSLAILAGGFIHATFENSSFYLDGDGHPSDYDSIATANALAGLPSTYTQWRYCGMLSDGDQLFQGLQPLSSSVPATALLRMHADGTVDRTFGGAGTGLFSGDLDAKIGDTVSSDVSTYVSADRRHIYLVGSAGSETRFAARLDAGGAAPGTFDPSFGTQGIVILGKVLPFIVTDVVEQPSGSAVMLMHGDGIYAESWQRSVIRLLGGTGGSPGIVGFTAQPMASEADGRMKVLVSRTAGKQGPLSVDYATSDRTGNSNVNAHAGVDYSAVSGTLTWADGDATDKEFYVPIAMDQESEEPEYFFVSLNPSPDTIILSSVIEARINNSAVAGSGSSGGGGSSGSGGGGAIELWELCLLTMLTLTSVYKHRSAADQRIRKIGSGGRI